MATTTRSATTILLLLTLLATTPPPSHSLPFFTNYRTFLSLAHSLITRVANHRASRHDYAGAARAQSIAQKIERGMGLGLGFWRVMLNMGWDYFRNYSWRTNTFFSFEMLDSVSDLNELLTSLNELTRLESDAERVAWVQRNYKNVLRVSKSFFTRLLKVFGQAGPLREVVETLQKEVVEGDLLRDCLELGASDLKGLTQVLKDVALQYTSATYGRTDL